MLRDFTECLSCFSDDGMTLRIVKKPSESTFSVYSVIQPNSILRGRQNKHKPILRFVISNFREIVGKCSKIISNFKLEHFL